MFDDFPADEGPKRLGLIVTHIFHEYQSGVRNQFSGPLATGRLDQGVVKTMDNERRHRQLRQSFISWAARDDRRHLPVSAFRIERSVICKSGTLADFVQIGVLLGHEHKVAFRFFDVAVAVGRFRREQCCLRFRS